MTRQLPKKLRLGAALLLGPGLAGCAVYMPMQCAAPAIHDKKQVELSGSLYFNRRLEFGANYSPVRHLLVRAAGGGMGDRADSTYYRGSQYELAAGTYWPLGGRVLLGALGGFGQAHGQARYAYNAFVLFRQYQLDARYNKTFGEVYGTVRIGDATSVGLAYRLTEVRFTGLTNLGQPVDIGSMLRSEPMFFVRTAFGSSPGGERPLSAQFGFGASKGLDHLLDSRTSGPEAEVLQSRTYFTLGLGLSLNSLFRQP